MAMPPRSVAVKDASEPESLPIGVRADETITEPGMLCLRGVPRGDLRARVPRAGAHR